MALGTVQAAVPGAIFHSLSAGLWTSTCTKVAMDMRKMKKVTS